MMDRACTAQRHPQKYQLLTLFCAAGAQCMQSVRLCALPSPSVRGGSHSALLLIDFPDREDQIWRWPQMGITHLSAPPPCISALGITFTLNRKAFHRAERGPCSKSLTSHWRIWACERECSPPPSGLRECESRATEREPCRRQAYPERSTRMGSCSSPAAE